jgi:hypothetical protein
VRVQRRQHALDGILDELLIGDFFHVVRAHTLEDFGKQLQLPISVGGIFLCRRELRQGDE